MSPIPSCIVFEIRRGRMFACHAEIGHVVSLGHRGCSLSFRQNSRTNPLCRDASPTGGGNDGEAKWDDDMVAACVEFIAVRRVTYLEASLARHIRKTCATPDEKKTPLREYLDSLDDVDHSKSHPYIMRMTEVVAGRDPAAPWL